MLISRYSGKIAVRSAGYVGRPWQGAPENVKIESSFFRYFACNGIAAYTDCLPRNDWEFPVDKHKATVEGSGYCSLW
ncbi:Protein of unknown function [Pyronema omphalodes CBS 100304]|uniref:Uncharacterized protein n=1 Tax=Pyronema omphalodes (strain CBS 100304) TaxID=1076935 RepID=U4L076_PYROM|nr:Protein of unknown function [Pyronema omphalodes CBS 100304]